MLIKLIIYAICLLASVFAVSGLNIEPLIKKGAVNEARVFTILLIFTLASGAAALLTFFVDYVSNVI